MLLPIAGHFTFLQVHEQNLARLEAISTAGPGGSEEDNQAATVIIGELKKMFRDGRELLRLNQGLVEVERERLAAEREQLVRMRLVLVVA